MAGTLQADTLTHSTAGSIATNYVVEGSAKSWLFFEGQTPAVRDSFNVASMTDNGNGDFTQNMSSSFSSGNYTASGGSGTAASDYRLITPNFNAVPTSSATRMRTHHNSSTATNDLYCSHLCHGDLA